MRQQVRLLAILEKGFIFEHHYAHASEVEYSGFLVRAGRLATQFFSLSSKQNPPFPVRPYKSTILHFDWFVPSC